MTRRLLRGARLVLATHNRGKVAELAALLEPHAVDVVAAGTLGLPEPEETAPDFAGNARLKAVAAAASGLPALADDSGFCVAALGGAPGVLSARWAGPEKDFGQAMARVSREMGAAVDRRAWFVCALCLAWPDGETATFLGRAEGQVVWPARGALGFGYDPMFVPAGFVPAGFVPAGFVPAGFVPAAGALTYGEMAPEEKHAISHRARAMRQLLAACLA